jgi:osmoprotectant transport system permease protein
MAWSRSGRPRVIYSLLPIVRNTYTGLTTLAKQLLESAEALGLPAGAHSRPCYYGAVAIGLERAGDCPIRAARINAGLTLY